MKFESFLMALVVIILLTWLGTKIDEAYKLGNPAIVQMYNTIAGGLSGEYARR